MIAQNPSQRRIAELVKQAGGWLPFDRFMADALYHPVHGYYSKRVRTVGSRGDFTTAAEQSPLLGQALAKWARLQKKRLRAGWNWHVIEVGGGSGQLARTLLQTLGIVGRLGLHYHLVEVSQALQAEQAKNLRGLPVCWHSTVANALSAAGGAALLFSNELVDAFPCRRFRWVAGQWQEIGLISSANGIEESLRPLTELEINAIDSSALVQSEKMPVNQAVEVHFSYRAELEEIARLWQRGVMLTIDYGDRFPQVYHRQPTGTVRGYVHHLRCDGAEIYERAGQQDITADVNFTDLENWGAQLGWRQESWEIQRDFLTRMLGKLSAKTTVEGKLLDPVGAGGAFKVLQQTCGLEP